jgi:hypothetical protein
MKSLKKNVAEYTDRKRRAQGCGALARGAGPTKRMVDRCQILHIGPPLTYIC